MKCDHSSNHLSFLPLFFSLLVGLTIALSTQYSQCFANTQRANILILHSYHVGYKWTDQIHAGMLDSFAEISSDITIHIEYMDMKRYFSEDRYELFVHTLGEKYKYIPIDYVLSSDDAALIFLKKYGRALFPNAIVSFCGANYQRESDLVGYPNFFGVTEEADIVANITTLRKIHPDTERIYIINDTTVTGKRVRQEIDKVVKIYSKQIEFIILDDLSLPELLERVEAIPPRSILLFSLFLRDKYGQPYEYYDAISLVYQKSPVPIYGLWDFYFGHGIIGGMVTNGYRQGEAAANIVIRLIQEGASASLQRLYHSPNIYMFDYNMLQQWGIDPDILPPDSVILNRPISFYQKHKYVLLSSAAAISALLVIILYLIMNISRRKVAEKKLLQSERNFRSIFENASEGLFQATHDGQFIKVNPSMARMLGCDSPDDALTTFTDIRNQLYVDPTDRDNLLAELASGTRIKNREQELVRKDGDRIIVLINLHELHDESGEFLYLEGSLTDITEQKKTEDKLRQAQKMEAIGTLAGGIAHDFNNILSALLGYTQLALLDSQQNSSVTSYLEEVVKASNRAKDLVMQILTISRKKESEKHPLQVSLIVKEALKLLRSSIPSSIDIIHDVSSSRLIIADSTEIHQVIMNLCTNAYHAMENEGGTLSVSLKECDLIADDKRMDPGFKPGKYLHLEVSDTGSGMDESTMAKIFEPYFTTKEPGSGTGLGLAVVSGIVSSCGGFIRVYSEPGHGTSFNVYFPIVASAEKLAPHPITDMQPELQGGTESILVVDDEEDVLKLHSELLEKFGYTVTAVKDSSEALNLFRTAPAHYSLVITDLTMPGLSGEQLGSELLKIRGDIPVIMVSGFSGAMNRTKFLDKGYADFIQKPVDVHNFLHRIREILDRKQP